MMIYVKIELKKLKKLRYKTTNKVPIRKCADVNVQQYF